MDRLVVLLRGINVGRNRQIPMPELRALLEALGVKDVVTYLQSGNAVFKARDRPRDLGPSIEKAIRRKLGVNVTALIRTQAQLAKVARANPFATKGRDAAKLHVTFLAEKPAAARVRELDPDFAEPDEFRVVGREVYLYCPNGYGRSKLTNALFEKRLGVAATTRNWSTTTKLAELAGG
jgi:uncharacterized protein (DUF1697 family)